MIYKHFTILAEGFLTLMEPFLFFTPTADTQSKENGLRCVVPGVT